MATRTTRDHLIEVGLEQIRSSSYNATGVKEILDRAGVPKGSFYHYFPSKEVFTEEVLNRYMIAETQRLQDVLGDIRLAPLKRLRRYFEALTVAFGMSAPIGGCLLGQLTLEIADQSPRLQPLLRDAFAHWQHGIANVLREAVERGDLSRAIRPDDLAAFLLNGWQGALVRMKAEKSDQPLENFIHIAFNILLKK
jgi:TetR/AcrR family transcriptional regulator, transcriptional repressor for nem operon